jgi:multidrug efflux pump subunit AcrA (membrane-fusion protein)
VVRLGVLESRTFADEILVSGVWRSGGDLVIAAPFDGVLDVVAAHPGDNVAAGDTLAVLVTRESEAALRGAELMLHEARDAAARGEAERALALARRERVRVPLAAPRAGVVSRRSAEPGAQVAQGAEILTLVPESAIVFEARVAPGDSRRLRRGQGAVVLEDGHAPRGARLDRILPAAGSGDQSTLCWLAREGAGDPPALDRFASARITLGPPHRGVGVPDSAAVEDDLTGTTRIATVGADGRLTWTTVTLGAEQQGWRELSSPPIPAGARVVIEGQRGLADHARVRAAP